VTKMCGQGKGAGRNGGSMRRSCKMTKRDRLRVRCRSHLGRRRAGTELEDSPGQREGRNEVARYAGK